MAGLMMDLMDAEPARARLLDPGIGDGSLSVAAKRALTAAGRQAELVGVDLSEELLRDATTRLEMEGTVLNAIQTDFLRVRDLGEFDAVVCNPPYGKRSQAALGAHLVAEYRDAISGHPNLFALFIHKIIRTLRNRGVAVVICPRSILSGSYFSALRKYMAENVSIERLVTFDQRDGLFDDVLQGVCIIGIRKGVRQGPCTVVRFDSAGSPDSWEIDNLYIDGTRLDHRIIPGRDASSRVLIEGAVSFPISIGDRFQVETGPLVWFRAKTRLIAPRHLEEAAPVIWSDQVGDGYIHAGRREDRMRNVALTPFAARLSKTGPAVVVKRVTAPEEPRRLVAGIMPPEDWKTPVLYENHTNVIRSKSGRAVEIVALGLLFASNLFDELLRMLSETTQVGAADLRLLPWLGRVVDEHHRAAVLEAVADHESLGDLVFLSELEERLLEEMSTTELRDPHIGSKSDVVDLTLPFSKPSGRPVHSGETINS
jgi:adenine-specific DNA-methyltransferase